MNISITLFTAQFNRNVPLVVLTHGLKLEYRESLFLALLNALKTFERDEQRNYPYRRVRVKCGKRGKNKKKWVRKRPPEAFAEKTLFLLDPEGNRLPLLPTKDLPERHLLTSVGKLKNIAQFEKGMGVLPKAFLNVLPEESNLVLRFGGIIPS